MMSANNHDQLLNTSASSAKQRQFTGRVTKLLDNFGFVDDDVFFQLSVVNGNVQVGSEVFVECQYSEQLPFKWNATKIEPISRQTAGQTSIASTYLQHRMLSQQKQHDALAQSYYVQDITNNPVVSSQTQPVYATDYKQTQFSSSQQPMQTNIQPSMSQSNQPPPSQGQTGPQPQSYSDYSQMNYFSRQQDYNNSQFPHITYTSMPGSAFFSTQIMPYTQQQQSNNNKAQQKQPVPNQRQQNFENSYKAVGSRWEDNRNRNENRVRREQRNRFDDRERNRERERDRQRERNQSDWNLDRVGERNEKSNDREKNRFLEYDRDKRSSREIEKNDIDKRRSTESPLSTTSGTSKGTRRRYDPINIPKYPILKPVLNVYDIKQKYGTSIHIPSDFKEVRVDPNINLNIMNIPKPIVYRICDRALSSKGIQEIDRDNNKEGVEEKMTSLLEKKEESRGKFDEKTEKNNENEKVVKCEKFIDEKNDELIINNNIRDDNLVTKEPKINIYNKYAVKVVLLSLPSMNEIYDQVFGSDRDSYSNSKTYFLHFNKLFSFLCSKNHNEGLALIGGKFDSSLDGFLDNSQNPNLIATAIRCVKQQTGIDLSLCKRWKHIISFVYNRDDSLAKDAPLEFSYIFLPDVWSILGDNLFKMNNLNFSSQEDVSTLKSFKNELFNNTESNLHLIKNEIKNETVASVCSQENASASFQHSNDSNTFIDSSFDSPKINSNLDSSFCFSKIVSDLEMFPKRQTTNSNLIPLISDMTKEDYTQIIQTVQNVQNVQNSQNAHIDEKVKKTENTIISERQTLLDNLTDFKVADLKTHLETRGIKVKSNAKKLELINKLREVLLQEYENDEETSDSVKENWWARQILSKEDKIKKNENDNCLSLEASIDQQIDQKSINLHTNCQDLKKKEEEKNFNTITNSKQEQEVKIDYESVTTINEKRKNEFDFKQSLKKIKTEESSQSADTTINSLSLNKCVEDCIVASGDMNLCVISLHQALNHHKYDHFELVVTGEVIKEELIRHFSHYIISTLVWNKKNKNKEDVGHSSKAQIDNNYALLAFAYFDSCHCGYILVDDLLKLFHNSNISLSKKIWTSLLGTDDKVYYRFFKEPEKLVDLTKSDFVLQSLFSHQTSFSLENSNIFVKDGSMYDVLKLINQAEQDEKIKIGLKDKVKILYNKLEKQREQIKESEAKQSRIDVAIEKSNDEICALKREKESLRIKCKEMHDAIDSWLNTFGDMMKKHKDEKK